MNDDLDLDLEGAFRAVKDTYDGASPDADLTLQRALFASRRRVKRRKITQWVLIPIAAALFASTAWAGATGRLAPVVESVRDAFHAEAPDPTPTSTAKPTAATPSPSTSSEPEPTTQTEPLATIEPAPAEPALAAVAEPAATAVAASRAAPAKSATHDPPHDSPHDSPASSSNVTVARSSPANPSAAIPNQRSTAEGSSQGANGASALNAPVGSDAIHTPEPTSKPSAPSAPRPDGREAALFAEANRLHFTERDPARALPAWDRYLAAAPNGSLAPEARYNRALALIRLNRTAEARAELETFANGTYRRAEARALLDALARDAGAP